MSICPRHWRRQAQRTRPCAGETRRPRTEAPIPARDASLWLEQAPAPPWPSSIVGAVVFVRLVVVVAEAEGVGEVVEEARHFDFARRGYRLFDARQRMRRHTAMGDAHGVGP